MSVPKKVSFEGRGLFPINVSLCRQTTFYDNRVEHIKTDLEKRTQRRVKRDCGFLRIWSVDARTVQIMS